MISRLDLMSDLLPIFAIFDVFWTPFWGVFWDKYVKKWSMEKESKKESKKGHAVNEVCGRGGGQRRGGRLRLAALQGVCTIVQHALLPLNEVRRIYRLPPLPPTSQQPMNRIIDDSMTR